MTLRAAKYSDLISTPWREPGSAVVGAMSCWELVREYFHRAGVELPDEPGPEGWRRVDTLPLEVNDLVVLKSDRPLKHAGVIVDGLRVLHADEHRGACLIDFVALERTGRLEARYRREECFA